MNNRQDTPTSIAFLLTAALLGLLVLTILFAVTAMEYRREGCGLYAIASAISGVGVFLGIVKLSK